MTKRTKFPVPAVDGIDLDFRPASYWDPTDPLSAITRNIKGQRRREMARDFIVGNAAERLGPIASDLLEDEVSEGTREFLGRIHPQWMGGEYLPRYRRGEVEIARIALRSTTGDVISFRARRWQPGSRILYRVVDEYQTNYTVTRKSSSEPLSLRELIAFIDSVEREEGHGLLPQLPFVESFIEHNADGDVDFVRLESTDYPMLGTYYEQRVAAWKEST